MNKTSMMIKARKLFKDVTDLPTIPAVVANVVSMLDNMDSDPEEVADLMLSDQVLAARIIRVVNSPLFSANREITSVKHALMYIGFKSVREIILTSYFINSFSKDTDSFNSSIFWEHSFNVGLMSRFIARQTGYPDHDKAYLAGIIHDIGKVLLGCHYQDEYSEVIKKVEDSNCSTYLAEYDLFGTTHCEAGFCLAQNWRFPAHYGEVIANHHDAEQAAEDAWLVAVVALADHFALTRCGSSPVSRGEAPGVSEQHALGVLIQHAKVTLPAGVDPYMDSLVPSYEDVRPELQKLLDTISSV